MSTYEVVKCVTMNNTHGGTTSSGEFLIATEKSKEDALVLAQLYAEEHYDRIYCDSKVRVGIGAIADEKNIFAIGYRFLTSNGSLVEYKIQEKK